LNFRCDGLFSAGIDKSLATRQGECAQSLAIPSYNNLDNGLGRYVP
jgi:hypothetical protein